MVYGARPAEDVHRKGLQRYNMWGWVGGIANETVAVIDVVSQVPDKMSFWLAIRRLLAPQRD